MRFRRKERVARRVEKGSKKRKAEWRQRTVVVAPRGRSYTVREKLRDEGGNDYGREKER